MCFQELDQVASLGHVSLVGRLFQSPDDNERDSEQLHLAGLTFRLHTLVYRIYIEYLKKYFYGTKPDYLRHLRRYFYIYMENRLKEPRNWGLDLLLWLLSFVPGLLIIGIGAYLGATLPVVKEMPAPTPAPQHANDRDRPRCV
jgi:hypothetical protein